jgi:hypothetical protein
LNLIHVLCTCIPALKGPFLLSPFPP